MANNNRTAFSPRSPHFFKIILAETLQEDKLRIPNKFVKKHGETLSDTVSVKLPCGSAWKMRLWRNADGKVWHKVGWPEFVKRYSIRRGDLLVFRYEGNSKFHVVICDTTTVEIDYPCLPAHVSKGGVTEDEFVEVLDDCSPRRRRAEKTPLPHSRPCKRMRTNPTSESGGDKAHPKPGGSKTFLDKPMSKGGSRNCSPEVKGQQNLPAENDTAKPTVRRRGRLKTVGCVKPLQGSERNAALQKARGFESKYPFFQAFIQSFDACYRRLTIPSEFARKYLGNKSNAILKASDARTWSVKCVAEAHTNGYSTITRFKTGWKDFSQDNNLGIGDVCVFVLLNRVKFLFEVVIFHASRNTMSPTSPAPQARAIKAEYEERVTDKTEFHGVLRSRGKSPAKQAKGCKSTVWNGRMNSKPKAIKRQCCLSPRILDRTPFESRKPFFKEVMQPSYIGATACPTYMPIPLDFARNYGTKEGDVLLIIPKNRSWNVQLHTWPIGAGEFVPVFYVGWQNFVEDNSLQVDDVCVFELVNRIKISFRVYIFRAADYDTNRRHSRAGGSSTSGSKQVKTKTVRGRVSRCNVNCLCLFEL